MTVRQPTLQADRRANAWASFQFKLIQALASLVAWTFAGNQQALLQSDLVGLLHRRAIQTCGSGQPGILDDHAL